MAVSIKFNKKNRIKKKNQIKGVFMVLTPIKDK